jgi:predicted double-glycine peptidase
LIDRAAHFLAAAAIAVTAAASAPLARAQQSVHSLSLLDVPYLPQSEALCGGAAIAMVMRYWGESNVYAETFADLVDRAAAGIRGQDLLNALQSRGWQAISFRGDAAAVTSHLAARRPVVALIEDRPGRFHYVVIVGWAGGRVVVHDPARAPFRVLNEAAFTAAWKASGYWTLVATPGSSTPRDKRAAASTPDDRDSAPSASTPCRDVMQEGIGLAGAGDLDAARRSFEIAAQRCPSSAAPWREMAGLHALRSEWRAAAADARRALGKDPADAMASRILATALFLDGDPDGALDAWNRVGEPLVDIVNITGLGRIRYGAAARAIGLRPNVLLTRRTLEAARRRLADLPAARTTRVAYRPGEDGRAQVDAVILERPLVPASAIPLAAIALHAATDRELGIGVASPTGGGELWTASWRWWERRPRVAAGFAAPAPFGGMWGVDVFDERQSYAGGEAPIEEARRRARFHVSDWTGTGLRWEAAVSFDRWRGTGRAVSFALSGQQRLAGDRAFVEGRAASWSGDVRTWTVGTSAEWRSTPRNEGPVWIGRGGADAAGSRAPLALWPGAGTGQGRDALLRAHPLLAHGVIRDGVFGRRLAYAGVEWRRWLQPGRKPFRVAPAFFFDTARASRGLASFDRRWQSDLGAGLRLALPGSGVVRLDFAYGLRDGSTAVSAGWGR